MRAIRFVGGPRDGEQVVISAGVKVTSLRLRFLGREGMAIYHQRPGDVEVYDYAGDGEASALDENWRSEP